MECLAKYLVHIILRTSQCSLFLVTVSKEERASLVAQSAKNLPAMQETRVQSLGQEDPLKKGMATCLENPMNRGAW